MSWIPPYAVDACLKALATRFEGADHRPENVVTRLGLQFWGPAVDGGLEFVRHDGIRVGASDVEKVVAFAHERGISAALCVQVSRLRAERERKNAPSLAKNGN